MVQLSRESDFVTLQSNVNDLLSSIDSIGNSAGTVASESANSLSSLQFGSWDDDVSTTLKNYCTAAMNGMNEVVSDITGGQFKVLVSALSDLITGLGCCITCKDNVSRAEDELSHTPATIDEYRIVNGTREVVQIRNSRFYELQQIRDSNYASLDSYIEQCYGIISIIESVQYNGTTTYTPAAFADLGDGGNGSGDEEGIVSYKPVTAEQLDSIYDGNGIVLYDANGNKFTAYRDANGNFNFEDSEGNSVGTKSIEEIMAEGKWTVKNIDKTGGAPSTQSQPTTQSQLRFSSNLPADASWFATDSTGRVLCATPDPNSEDDFIVYDAITGERVGSESMMSYATSHTSLSADEMATLRGEFDTDEGGGSSGGHGF